MTATNSITGIKTFANTNVLVYPLSSDTAKADKAEAILREGCMISVQVLNEITQARRIMWQAVR